MQNGSKTNQGQVIVQDHIPKVKVGLTLSSPAYFAQGMGCKVMQYPESRLQDFFSKECFKGHPKPYADFMAWRFKEDDIIEAERQKLIPGM